jgi:hypothetical protein
MPIFTAIAAGITAIAGAIGFSAAVATTIGAVGAFAARTLLTIGISKLIANRATDQGAQGAGNAGARIQLPPATNNKLPVVYGSAFVAPTITDAIISTDQTTMWYVCALSEVTDSGTISYGDIYYDGQFVTFAGSTGDDANKVASLTNNAQPPQTDTKIAGNMNIYLFTDGSSSGINTNGKTAIQILSDASIPAYSQWDVNKLMSKTAFMIVKLVYNQNAGTTNLGQFSVQVQNSLNKPGSVIQDYLTNTRYGCAVPVANIDTTSLTLLNTYSDELITFIPVGGGTATQARYRINGPVNTGQNCLTNLQELTDACDSWLQYSELTGKWKVVINQSYTDYTTIDNLFLVDSYNLIGGIDINPIDLNQTFNSLEVQYPDANIRDQINYKVFNLVDYVPEVMSPNEAANQLVVSYPQVNNYIQSAYLGERRLLQSREDLVITCSLDYSGIQLTAGDVIRVKQEQYGWDVLNGGKGKLFRVSQVQETKDDSGFLGARITAFEYNDTIYANNPLNDFIPEANSGLSNPRLLDTPGTPILSTNPLTDGTVASFHVVSTTPSIGSTMYMDFNYGTTTNTATHKLYKTVQTSTGLPFANTVSVSIDVADLPPATYYWSVTARTDTTGYRSGCSSAYVWSGPNVTTYNSGTGQGGLNFNQLSPGATGAVVVTSYDVPNYGSSLQIPVSATSTTSRNIPLIYPGSDPGSSYIFPYAQGTASTTNGYSANSTAPWTPASSALLYISTSLNSYQNWYKLIGVNLSSVAWQTTQLIISQGTFNVSSDTANTLYQIVPYARFSNDTGRYTLQTQYLQTYITSNANPYTAIASFTINLRAAAEVIEVGAFIRNITASSNLTVYAGTYAVQQRYIGPGSII